MSDDGEHDARLIEALTANLEPARRWFQHFEQQAREGVFRERPSPSLDELTPPVRTAMSQHPKFKDAPKYFFGPIQLMRHTFYQAPNFLKIAAEEDPAAALAWGHKVYSTNKATIRYVAEVYGLSVTEPKKLSNGVMLVPMADLPPSGNAMAVQQQFRPRPGEWSPPTITLPIGAIYEVPDVEAVEQGTETDQALGPRSEILETTIRAFTLADDAAPVVAKSWFEFVDPDLAKSEFGRTSMMPCFEGPLGFFAINVNNGVIDWAEKYIALSADLRPVCDVAIDRLNLARRRYSAGNKAIEGGICLEALLGSGDKQEINYRLKLRAALFLETELEKRREILEAVGKFYSLRSSTVHGNIGKMKDTVKNDAAAKEGLDICAKVLRKMVSLNRKFVPEDWELSGGQPPQ